MTDLLIVVDMQRDFVSGALGSEQARAIVPAVAARIQQAKAENTQVVFTLDTHEENYMNTREGRFLPVPHCIRNTPGWALEPEIAQTCARGMMSFEKPTFGSTALCEYVCTLAAVPEADLTVNGALCAGVTPQKHEAALETMRSCQVEVL